MALSVEDRVAINELLSRHGHLIDAGELLRLDELFTSNVIYDISDFTGESLHGLEAIRKAALALGAHNPLGHHITNVVVDERAADEATAVSKGIGVNADGSASSVIYEDTVTLTADGWRISRRRVRARREPLSP